MKFSQEITTRRETSLLPENFLSITDEQPPQIIKKQSSYISSYIYILQMDQKKETISNYSLPSTDKFQKQTETGLHHKDSIATRK